MQQRAEPERPVHHLRAWRKHHGLTLMQLANDVGSSFQNLSNVENGRTRLTAELAEKIAKIYGVTMHVLLTNAPSQDGRLEADLLSMFRAASPRDRRTIVALARTIVGLGDEADPDGTDARERLRPPPSP